MACRIVVLVGLPGSGKSSYLETLGVSSLSSDHLRYLLADDPNDQTIHRRVFACLRKLLVQRIEIGREVSYVDATHLTRWERRPYLRLGQMLGCEVEAWFFDTPLGLCKERNRSRVRVVPDDVMDMLAARLAPPSMEEGFSSITRISTATIA